MKQVFQDVSKGDSLVVDVPRPNCRPKHLLVRSTYSLISTGTERMLVDFGRANYFNKARQQPEKVNQALSKIRTDGLLTTVESVRAKLDEPLAMGCSNVGIVMEVGEGITEFVVGDRVVSNGNHAEIVCVPMNLCAKIPDDVQDIDAVFTVIGAIALQGVRLIQPTIGECFVVTGLGLIGLLTVQILRANGCRVLGIDFDSEKLELARSYGADTIDLSRGQDPISAAELASESRGVDGVIITASTKSDEPIQQAAKMCRKRGRIVLVGVAGLNIQRSDFYDKEIQFQVSCSYGPGRYDPNYEDMGHDYPFEFVRWTEKRNFGAILTMFSSRALTADQLRSGSFKIEDAAKAYDILMDDRTALGLIIDYSQAEEATESELRTLSISEAPVVKIDQVVIGAIGAGNYAGRILLPAFKSTGARLKTIISYGGVSGTHHGKKLGFEFSSTDVDAVFSDRDINTIVIASQHDSHAGFVVDSINAGKNVFVEKPLALNDHEINQIEAAYKQSHDDGNTVQLMVGFNRRFAPLVKRLKTELNKSKAPISIIYTCNAGHVARNSWIQDLQRGGGRIAGEACHFIDLARFLADSPIADVQASGLKQAPAELDCHDTATVTISFKNGSLATILYFANGHRNFPKERVEIFQNGKILVLDNFRRLKGYGTERFDKHSIRQDKGQTTCCGEFVKSLQSGGAAPIAFDELIEVTRITIRAAKALASS